MDCVACDAPPRPERMVYESGYWRVVHADDPAAIVGKLYVTLQRHAESLADLTPDEARILGPILAASVQALESELTPERVHVASYGEELRHVHFHVTARTRNIPRGNVPTSLWLDFLGVLVRLHLRRPADAEGIDMLVQRLARQVAQALRT